MAKAQTRTLHTYSFGFRKIETFLVQVLNGPSQVVTKVNGKFEYIDGLTSVKTFTNLRDAGEQHTQWIRAYQSIDASTSQDEAA